MPRMSGWDQGLLPHELPVKKVAASGLSEREASESTGGQQSQSNGHEGQVGEFDQPGDDPRGLSLEALRHQTHVA